MRKTGKSAPQQVQKMMELRRDRGLLVGRGGMAAHTLRSTPPLCIDKNDRDYILKTLDECFSIVAAGSQFDQ